MTSMTTEQREELPVIPDGAQEPFDMKTIVEPAEIGRLAWWFLQIFPVNEDSLYIETMLDVGTPTPVWGVRIVKTVFNVRYGVEEDGPTWHITPPIYNVEIGAIGGLSSKGVTSLKEIQRAKYEPWQRTIYDTPPAKIYAHHRRIVAKTVRYARDVVEERLQEEDDSQSTHLQELEAFLSVAQGYAPPLRQIMDAVKADDWLPQRRLRETFLQVTQPLTDTRIDDSNDSGKQSAAAAIPDHFTELPLFAAAN